MENIFCILVGMVGTWFLMKGKIEEAFNEGWDAARAFPDIETPEAYQGIDDDFLPPARPY